MMTNCEHHIRSMGYNIERDISNPSLAETAMQIGLMSVNIASMVQIFVFMYTFQSLIAFLLLEKESTLNLVISSFLHLYRHLPRNNYMKMEVSYQTWTSMAWVASLENNLLKDGGTG